MAEGGRIGLGIAQLKDRQAAEKNRQISEAIAGLTGQVGGALRQKALWGREDVIREEAKKERQAEQDERLRKYTLELQLASGGRVKAEEAFTGIRTGEYPETFIKDYQEGFKDWNKQLGLLKASTETEGRQASFEALMGFLGENPGFADLSPEDKTAAAFQAAFSFEYPATKRLGRLNILLAELEKTGEILYPNDPAAQKEHRDRGLKRATLGGKSTALNAAAVAEQIINTATNPEDQQKLVDYYAATDPELGKRLQPLVGVKGRLVGAEDRHVQNARFRQAARTLALNLSAMRHIEDLRGTEFQERARVVNLYLQAVETGARTYDPAAEKLLTSFYKLIPEALSKLTKPEQKEKRDDILALKAQLDNLRLSVTETPGGKGGAAPPPGEGGEIGGALQPTEGEEVVGAPGTPPAPTGKGPAYINPQTGATGLVGGTEDKGLGFGTPELDPRTGEIVVTRTRVPELKPVPPQVEEEARNLVPYRDEPLQARTTFIGERVSLDPQNFWIDDRGFVSKKIVGGNSTDQGDRVVRAAPIVRAATQVGDPEQGGGLHKVLDRKVFDLLADEIDNIRQTDYILQPFMGPPEQRYAISQGMAKDVLRYLGLAYNGFHADIEQRVQALPSSIDVGGKNEEARKSAQEALLLSIRMTHNFLRIDALMDKKKDFNPMWNSGEMAYRVAAGQDAALVTMAIEFYKDEMNRLGKIPADINPADLLALVLERRRG
jgi:hypothetical protein